MERVLGTMGDSNPTLERLTQILISYCYFHLSERRNRGDDDQLSSHCHLSLRAVLSRTGVCVNISYVLVLSILLRPRRMQDALYSPVLRYCLPCSELQRISLSQAVLTKRAIGVMTVSLLILSHVAVLGLGWLRFLLSSGTLYLKDCINSFDDRSLI